jgi:hypothetical protein
MGVEDLLGGVPGVGLEVEVEEGGQDAPGGGDAMASISEDCYDNAFRSGIDPREPILARFLVEPIGREAPLYPLPPRKAFL